MYRYDHSQAAPAATGIRRVRDRVPSSLAIAFRSGVPPVYFSSASDWHSNFYNPDAACLVLQAIFPVKTQETKAKTLNAVAHVSNSDTG
jgi:hypothetical protein